MRELKQKQLKRCILSALLLKLQNKRVDIIKKTASFQIQLILAMAFLLSMTLLSLTVFVFSDLNDKALSSQIDKIIMQARYIGAQSKPALLVNNEAKINETLAHLKKDLSIKFAAILQPNKTILGFFSVPEGMPLPDIEISPPLTISDTRILIVEPIIDAEKIIGYIYVTHNPSDLNQQNLSLYFIILTILIISMLIWAYAAKYFQLIMLHPIKRMTKHVNELCQSRDFKKRLTTSTSDDFSILINQFNQMLDAVEEREDELKIHSKHLARLVEVRTEQLYQKAHFDALTGLPNRYLLVDRLQQAISKSARNQLNLALLFLDLDRFKIINDNLGHQNGDQLLKEVATRLSNLGREGDTVARLGGDEFVFLLENLSSPKDAVRMAHRIIQSLKKPFKLQSHTLHLSTSIGISLYPMDGKDDKVLLKNADISMYHAKQQGPGQFSFYDQKMNNSSLERLAIENNLRFAIDNNEFYLVYQPQLNISSNRYHNVEALLRWKNPQIGNVSPGIFVPIAEETGMVNPIDLWVISEACRQIGIWKQQGFSEITVAINVSAGHLISDELLEHLKKEILLNKIKASQVEIEITEAVFVEHTERTIETLKAIKNMGVKIAIDDFGTGYSSLQYIQNFPTDTLKLDGMFIRDLENNPSSQGIVRSTIILAHSLGLELVSECVENQFQFDFLRQHQCDLLQGFLLSKPLLPAEVPLFCKEKHAVKSS